MKHIILIILFCLLAVRLQAETNMGKISYYPVVVSNEIPESVKVSLTAKMEQALTQNGYGSNNRADRFVMVAKCSVVEKNVAPTTPARITQTIDVIFILGDAIENKTYASTAFTLMGIGTNEAKAWQTAINKFKPTGRELSEMFASAFEKIKSYYTANCQSIINNAHALAARGEYDRAISLLMSVPDIITDCHNKAQTEASAIYRQKINAEGEELLRKAQNAWAASPNNGGAEIALSYINSISPLSESFVAAESLVKVIGDKISSDKEREWQQRVKQYNDEMELRKGEQSNAQARSLATIAACRSVAEKWAENQPQTKINLNW